ncbi:hypothetical protein A2331_00060 [Candidatus Falkowbacteria bacterium RIFOXYB2_FULL_34_18]|uniref:GIY-YIG domain-containing protein n=1 Tax=Candidatus Falkowbacteria bacterium RIFOXYD2_FULL_34_120 TaxID=1798007 RepID=A0A1F5TS05_9BACT|nr:MAG: hypothetical protein A2331_00060 [Candidatus Falkowbacteria bacterium RIFOXYB2_FULL_34_18]OGF29782.1 MAG: hypothetical protein A2500_01290 [Candidatus Falkowbacteria bacterium RIFOXYC12_FULL_34_55]OGF37489.1 MAG: hypothetical protein A2466_00620 [Candidatus Falkowbacteria bacterium RIFOXYC2_FULL_34_220]OGF39199.1 MAG: hypothetical protein A2515_01130 [Candidatus Falkowbacteria bacterium RIFOXYD12_FULL_34_57]OGF41766.1 MAG: hypothetical protein A2531_05790 [Candidatus Falkowbacteria bact
MIRLIESYIIKILNSGFVIDRRQIPKKQGVYLIYQKEKIIYVGESNNLYKRINSKHISGANTTKTSAFRQSLCKRLNRQPGLKLKKWILKNCRFKYVETEDSDLCHLVEKALIYKLRKDYNLLNK